jgi:hypothetical protein
MAEFVAKTGEGADLPLYHRFYLQLLSPEQLKVWIDIYKLKIEKI